MNKVKQIERLKLMEIEVSDIINLTKSNFKGGKRPLYREAVFYCYKIGRIVKPEMTFVPGFGNILRN